jgi:hypothetical protein
VFETVAPFATISAVSRVVTRTPSVSVPVQVVVPFAVVGSGAHCACAAAGSANPHASALVPSTNDRRRQRIAGAEQITIVFPLIGIFAAVFRFSARLLTMLSSGPWTGRTQRDGH